MNPRIDCLENVKYIIFNILILFSNILPFVLKRIYDKPNVAEISLNVGQYFIKYQIQAFPK